MHEFPLIDWPGMPPETRVRISARAKYLRLKVVPPGRVELVLPPRCDPHAIPAFVTQHRDWLIDTVERFRAEHVASRAARIAPAEITLPALDERWRVEYQTGQRQGWWERAGRGLLIRHRDDLWDVVLRRWLAERARCTLGPWLMVLAAELGLQCNGFSIRGQKTRWGSCSSKKIINLNWRLLFLPPEQVRYLMVHELCHTVHMNHSRRFWALVADKEPNYRQLDHAMRGAGKLPPAWALER